MNRMIARLATTATIAALVIVAVTTKDRVHALPVVHAAGSNPGCSVSTLKGDYAVHGQGTVVAQLPNLPP